MNGTKVKNPCRRSDGRMYSVCRWCNNKYTPLGISRHWDKCPKRPVVIPPVKE